MTLSHFTLIIGLTGIVNILKEKRVMSGFMLSFINIVTMYAIVTWPVIRKRQNRHVDVVSIFGGRTNCLSQARVSP